MKTYEITYEVNLTSYNTAVISIEADSKEEAIAEADVAMRLAEWDDIFETDNSLEDTTFLSIEADGEEE